MAPYVEAEIAGDHRTHGAELVGAPTLCGRPADRYRHGHEWDSFGSTACRLCALVDAWGNLDRLDDCETAK